MNCRASSGFKTACLRWLITLIKTRMLMLDPFFNSHPPQCVAVYVSSKRFQFMFKKSLCNVLTQYVLCTGEYSLSLRITGFGTLRFPLIYCL